MKDGPKFYFKRTFQIYFSASKNPNFGFITRQPTFQIYTCYGKCIELFNSVQ